MKKWIWFSIFLLYSSNCLWLGSFSLAAEDGGALKTEGVVSFKENQERQEIHDSSKGSSRRLPKAGEKGDTQLLLVGSILLLTVILTNIYRFYSVKEKWFLFCLVPLVGITIFPKEVNAVRRETGQIYFDKPAGNHIFDPEFPSNNVDPGKVIQAGQYLRVEFVPQLDFGINERSTKDQIYYANAQLFYGTTGARGNFIQISDIREKSLGWSLLVKQETQFASLHEQKLELDGAKLSLKQAWINSSHETAYPELTSQAIELTPGEIQQLASAEVGEGAGTWLLSFGASQENENNQKNSLVPKYHTNGQPSIDAVYQKPVYQNHAVTLAVPGKTAKKAAVYQTQITWILSELP
ncbi:WxL domain-containing protein [Enterococcus sp. AZ192]|uniref:WxL domain-containing protein n=1 Tax=unclassified Enterococcus TaxID=2608891 RepID=UPI003D29A48F